MRQRSTYHNYYDQFLYYYEEIARWQFFHCNLGNQSYGETPDDDHLVKKVPIYDVIERKYAGFTQLLLDMFYEPATHPYTHKMSTERKSLCESFDGARRHWTKVDWLFVFMVHRLTGSGIDYARDNSGYHNSILPLLGKYAASGHIYDGDMMCEIIALHDGPIFTSKGYQIARFPKPLGEYQQGGRYYLCEILPKMIYEFCEYLESKAQMLTFREMMDWLKQYHKSLCLPNYHFQFGAFLADIADFYPEHVDATSHFFYGSNAKQCLQYLALPCTNLDSIMDRIVKDTNMHPYNAEDVCCDFIRWIENYIQPGHAYDHLDLDHIWNSSSIVDHPYGRQKMMLRLGLVDSFNNNRHPTGDKIIAKLGFTKEQYQGMVYGYEPF